MPMIHMTPYISIFTWQMADILITLDRCKLFASSTSPWTVICENFSARKFPLNVHLSVKEHLYDIVWTLLFYFLLPDKSDINHFMIDYIRWSLFYLFCRYTSDPDDLNIHSTTGMLYSCCCVVYCWQYFCCAHHVHFVIFSLRFIF